MTTKKLDWSTIANVNFDDNRRKALGIMTGREMFAKAHENLLKSEAALQQRRSSEPLLRQALLNAMVTRSPITVLNPIKNPTETVGGLNKSDEDDGFYYNSPSRSAETTMNARFEEVMETIPVGTQLIFKSWDKQLGQYIFKSNAGQEYSIYDKAMIMFQGQGMENPGLFGLLYNTDLIKVLDNE